MKCGQKQDSCDSVSFCTDSFSCSLMFPLCRTEYLVVRKKQREKKSVSSWAAPGLLSQLSERLWCFTMEHCSESNATVMEQVNCKCIKNIEVSPVPQPTHYRCVQNGTIITISNTGKLGALHVRTVMSQRTDSHVCLMSCLLAQRSRAEQICVS